MEFGRGHALSIDKNTSDDQEYVLLNEKINKNGIE